MLFERKIVINNRAGLHARPAAVFVQTANKYESDITLVKDDQEVNGKSIMGILTLAAEKGAQVKIVAEGADAEAAVKELCGLLLSEDEAGMPGQGKQDEG